MRWGVTIGCVSVFISMVGASFTFPFLQTQRDRLGCDAMCYGSLMSARSALSLVGSVLVGRMSDKAGRIFVLWIGLSSSILSYTISYSMPTITGMWLACLPSSLLNQNFSVFKALFSDYNTEGECQPACQSTAESVTTSMLTLLMNLSQLQC